MRKNFPYIFLAFFLWGLAACSDEKENEPIPPGEKEEVVVYAGVSTSAAEVKTKADDTPFTKNFDLFYAINGSTLTTKVVTDYVTASSFYKTGAYWDDHNGVTGYVNMLGVFPKTSLAVSGLNAFSWSIQTNQNATASLPYTDVANGFEASDLLISEQISDYNLDNQKAKKALRFHHALSKVTFMLIPGKGFIESDEAKASFKPKVVLKNMKTGATVNAYTREVTPLTDGADITPKVLDPVVQGQTTAQQAAAILIPGQEFTKTAVFAQVTIEDDANGNVYDIKLPASFDTDNITLEQGKNHIIKITVRKTDVGLQATVKDWEDEAPIISEIKIDLLESTPIDDGANVENGALLFMEVDKQKNSYRYNANATGDETDWSALSTIFWDDVNYNAPTGIKAEGLLYNINTTGNNYTSVITEHPEHIYEGNSQTLIKANDVLRFGEMTHPFSKINIKVQSHISENDKVAIADIKKITLANSEKFKQVNTDPSEATYRRIDYENAEYSFTSITPVVDDSYNTYSMAAYIQPGQTFSDNADDSSKKSDLIMTVQVVTNGITNDYILRMPSGSVTFDANKEYNITATLKKTSVALAISITPWGTGSNLGGNAGIEE